MQVKYIVTDILFKAKKNLSFNIQVVGQDGQLPGWRPQSPLGFCGIFIAFVLNWYVIYNRYLYVSDYVYDVHKTLVVRCSHSAR